MKAAALCRIASVLMVLWAAGHTFGFRKPDPEWKADSVIAAMQSLHFNAQGFSRTYWDFFVGFGLFVSVFLLFAAILAWQLGGLAASAKGSAIRGAAWTLAICFAALAILSWRYFFILPVVFSIVITLCLSAAAWLSAKPS
jgi:hypothetical protein